MANAKVRATAMKVWWEHVACGAHMAALVYVGSSVVCREYSAAHSPGLHCLLKQSVSSDVTGFSSETEPDPAHMARDQLMRAVLHQQAAQRQAAQAEGAAIARAGRDKALNRHWKKQRKKASSGKAAAAGRGRGTGSRKSSGNGSNGKAGGSGGKEQTQLQLVLVRVPAA